MIKTNIKITRNGDVNKATVIGNQQGVLEVGIGITAQAKRLVPVDKGQLRNSLSLSTKSVSSEGFNDAGGEAAPGSQRMPNTPNDETAFVGSNSDHAIYPEFGTINQAAQPYLTPSVQIAAGQAPKDVAEQLNEAMSQELPKK
jgi:HK97 gp10 family phage protein